MEQEYQCTGTENQFTVFVAMDDNVLTCKPQSVREILVEIKGDKAEFPENDDNKDGGRCPLATFANALVGLDVLHSFSHAKDKANAERELQGRDDRCSERRLHPLREVGVA